MSDAVDDVVDWTNEHKPLALGIVGVVVLSFTLLAVRRRNSANGVAGATTAGGVGGMSLIPYGDATGSGGSDMSTNISDGFSVLSDQLYGITGLLTTMQPPGTAAIGGSDTGNTVPTPGGAGTNAGTGLVALPAAVPDPNTTALIPTDAAPASAPASSYPYPYAPATDPNNLPANYPTTVQPAPTYQGAPVSADIFTAQQNDGAGLPSGARYLGTYSELAAQQLMSGRTVLNGGVTPYKLVPGTNYAVPV